ESFQSENSDEKLGRAIFDAIFVLDAGTVDTVEKNDQFALAYEPTIVRGHGGDMLDRLPAITNILEAVEVHERVCYCKLMGLAYEPALARLSSAIEELEQQGIDEIGDAQIEKLILSMFGRRAVRIPREESRAAGVVKSAYSRVLEEDGRASRDKALRALLH